MERLLTNIFKATIKFRLFLTFYCHKYKWKNQRVKTWKQKYKNFKIIIVYQYNNIAFCPQAV